MKKVFVIATALLIGFVSSASAQQINSGQTASCNDAKSIEIAVAKIANTSNDKFGYTSNDRGTGNVSVWKSSNFTTIPISLGPNDSNQTVVATDHGLTGIGVRGTYGASKVVLNRETAFSRGDSIGDISGLVKITNIGTNPVSVNCM